MLRKFAATFRRHAHFPCTPSPLFRTYATRPTHHYTDYKRPLRNNINNSNNSSIPTTTTATTTTTAASTAAINGPSTSESHAMYDPISDFDLMFLEEDYGEDIDSGHHRAAHPIMRWSPQERDLLRRERERHRNTRTAGAAHSQQDENQVSKEKDTQKGRGRGRERDHVPSLVRLLELGAIDVDKWIVLQVTPEYGGMRLDRFLRTRQREQQRVQRYMERHGKRGMRRTAAEEEEDHIESVVYVPTMTVFQRMIRKNGIRSISAGALQGFQRDLMKSATGANGSDSNDVTNAAADVGRLRAEKCKNNDRVQVGDIVLVLRKAVEGYAEKVTTASNSTGAGLSAAREERAARVLRQSSRLTRQQIEEVQSWVLFENDECIVINKPSGLAVHGGSKQKVHVDMLLAALSPSLANLVLSQRQAQSSNAPHWLDTYSPEERKRMDQKSKSSLIRGDFDDSGQLLNSSGAYSIPKLVHRLDKDTSGCLVLAKTREAAHKLSVWFQPVWGNQYSPYINYHRKHYKKELQMARETEHLRVKDVVLKKCYWAVVKGKPLPTAGRIKMPLQRSYSAREGGDKVFAPDDASNIGSNRDIKMAISEYNTVESVLEELSWLSLYPQTGRLHQLRVHCATGLGCPIIGDEKYGVFSEERMENPYPESMESLFSNRKEEVLLHLHARAILLPYAFDNRVHVKNPNTTGFDGNKYTLIKAPLPQHMDETFQEFQFDIKKGDRLLFSFKKAR